ncbi:guanylate cyclase soluble subunit alpha-2-like [Tubulanus polymorphus]|uniref:guanylate cyclase soluble subunit alpha-2-like n=1 Tax=Tubulanus polymorphus TaxID=672921 RepID=UPI003DA6AC9A
MVLRFMQSPPITPSRKVTNLSTSTGSACSSDDQLGERKLDLRGLVEAVGTLIVPSTQLMNAAIRRLLNGYGSVAWDKIMKDVKGDDYVYIENESCSEYSPYDELELSQIVDKVGSLVGLPHQKLYKDLGCIIFGMCFERYERELKCLGSTLYDFLCNLDGLDDHLKENPSFTGVRMPSFRCSTRENGELLLYFYSKRNKSQYLLAGILESAARDMFQAKVNVKLQENDRNDDNLYELLINILSRSVTSRNLSITKRLSTDAVDSKIGVVSFCRSFPFHLMFDKELQITQLGTALMKSIAPEINTRGLALDEYFDIVRPNVKMKITSILQRINSTFVLKLKSQTRDNISFQFTLELKGQMVYVAESESVLFLGSPSVVKMDELIGKGIYISDIPIHDATRDVILVGEHTKAQEGLKKRMVHLKQSIEEANILVEAEKQKNVELLQLIFPADVARRLWLGQTVKPMIIEDVTMLFSDIVGFTAICSVATPLQVIDMLQNLYTKFDNFCELLDIYKIETIGDAYCCAGGLHRPSRYHAVRAAWMALKMMSAANSSTCHDGTIIKMRIGLHSGPVLAGVVGTKMPRYCLFGNHVTLANKFESGSVSGRINISPTTHSLLLANSSGFDFTMRSRDDLPVGFPDDVAGVPYFLNRYAREEQSDAAGADNIDHILESLKQINLEDS